MDYRERFYREGDTVLEGLEHFHLGDILECGQCFRWQKVGEGSYRGVVGVKARTLTQRDDRLILHGVDPEEFQGVWLNYLDLTRNYGQVKAILNQDPVMARAVAFTPGMRVLRQPPWETLCSFIISANNNITRIRGIVQRLCQLLGDPVEEDFTFPAPERMALLSPEDLAPLRCGYRAAYLIDAAKKVAGGELDWESLYTMPLPQARIQLRQIKGVGPKVAECVLLYGFARPQCMPVDVWIRRAMDTLYPQGMPPELQEVAGLGQQYLFHYVRQCPGALAV